MRARWWGVFGRVLGGDRSVASRRVRSRFRGTWEVVAIVFSGAGGFVVVVGLAKVGFTCNARHSLGSLMAE